METFSESILYSTLKPWNTVPYHLLLVRWFTLQHLIWVKSSRSRISRCTNHPSRNTLPTEISSKFTGRGNIGRNFDLKWSTKSGLRSSIREGSQGILGSPYQDMKIKKFRLILATFRYMIIGYISLLWNRCAIFPPNHKKTLTLR